MINRLDSVSGRWYTYNEDAHILALVACARLKEVVRRNRARRGYLWYTCGPAVNASCCILCLCLRDARAEAGPGIVIGVLSTPLNFGDINARACVPGGVTKQKERANERIRTRG